MFDFDAGKLVVIGVVALIVIGPKELPRVLRQVGQAVGKMRRMASDFQSQFMDAMRDAELAEVKAEMEKVAKSAHLDVAFDPVRDVRNQIGGALEAAAAPVASVPAADASVPLGNIDLQGAENSAEKLTADTMAEGGLVAAGIAPGTPEPSNDAPKGDAPRDDALKAEQPAKA